MRNFFIIFIVSLISNSAYSQHLTVSGKLLVNKKNNENVKILLAAKGQAVDSTYSNFNGYFEIDIPYNDNYILRFEKFGQVPKTILVVTNIPTTSKANSAIDIFLNFENAPFALDLSGLNSVMAKISYSEKQKKFIYDENFFMSKSEYDKILQQKIKEQQHQITSIQEEIKNISPAARKSLGIDIKEYEMEKKVAEKKYIAEKILSQSKKKAQKIVEDARKRAKKFLGSSLDTLENKNTLDTNSLAKQQQNLIMQRYLLEIERLNAKTQSDSTVIFKKEAELSQKETEISKKQASIEQQKKTLQLQKEKLRNRNILLFVSLLFLMILSAALLYIYRLNKKISKLNINLRETNELLEHHSLALSQTNNAVVIIDSASQIKWSNKAFARITGKSPYEIYQNFGNNLGQYLHLNLVEIAQKNDNSNKTIIEQKTENKVIYLQVSISKIELKNYDEQYIVILTDVSDLEHARIEIVHQKDILVKQNKKITDSIRYAKRIQNSILIPEKNIPPDFESFILFYPKDIVSGDFYYYKQIANNKYAFAAADCTGHGVPGAFVSLVSYEKLEQILIKKNNSTTAGILEELDSTLTNFLKQGDSETEDGLEIALCIVEKTNKGWKLDYSGAGRPLVISHGKTNELKVIKGQQRGIAGNKRYYIEKEFLTHKIEITASTRIYLYSDGITDQRSMLKKRYGTKNLFKLIEKVSKKTAKEQKNEFENIIFALNKNSEQRDDITLISFKLFVDESN